MANELGTGISGIQLFIKTIPYNFYSLLTFVFIFAIILLKFDYSKMRDAELQEKMPCKNDSSFSEDVAEKTENAPCNASVLDLLIPVCVLI